MRIEIDRQAVKWKSCMIGLCWRALDMLGESKKKVQKVRGRGRGGWVQKLDVEANAIKLAELQIDQGKRAIPHSWVGIFLQTTLADLVIDHRGIFGLCREEKCA